MKYTYTVLIKHEKDGESACVPALKYCITCGDTISDALSNAINAATGCLVTMENDGWAIPPDTSEGSDILGKADYTTQIICDTDLYRKVHLSAVA